MMKKIYLSKTVGLAFLFIFLGTLSLPIQAGATAETPIPCHTASSSGYGVNMSFTTEFKGNNSIMNVYWDLTEHNGLQSRHYLQIGNQTGEHNRSDTDTQYVRGCIATIKVSADGWNSDSNSFRRFYPSNPTLEISMPKGYGRFTTCTAKITQTGNVHTAKFTYLKCNEEPLN